MISFFKYNWAVRDEYFNICKQLPHDELVRERTGGVGSILRTLFHIIDVENSWVEAIKGAEVRDPSYEDYNSLELVENLSTTYRNNLKGYIESYTDDMEYKRVKAPWMDEALYVGEVLRHIIAHEIHHIGQLSIWVKENGVKPATAMEGMSQDGEA